jgi:hypothetical protein
MRENTEISQEKYENELEPTDLEPTDLEPIDKEIKIIMSLGEGEQAIKRLNAINTLIWIISQNHKENTTLEEVNANLNTFLDGLAIMIENLQEGHYKIIQIVRNLITKSIETKTLDPQELMSTFYEINTILEKEIKQ